MDKLYYADCMMQDFTARVVGCQAHDRGWIIELDATAFFPEGGGQACDLGTLGGVNVLDVREAGERILHLCDGPLEVGTRVVGKIHWQRRFDLMQQHSGEHIVSGLIYKKLGYHNVGFHVGAQVMEVDFDGPILQEQLDEIERQANEAVWADIPVKCWVPDPEELRNVVYRTKKALDWPVRIVEIPGYDSCACCGVHVERTGQIGLIKIISCIKFKGGVRLEMVCGGRAYGYMAEIFRQNRKVSQAFSAKMLETGEAALKMNEALAAEKFRCSSLKKQIFEKISESYVNQKNVLHFAEGLEPGDVRLLADRIAEVCEGAAAVFSGTEGCYSFCLASRQEDLRQLGRELTAALRGRGGGKSNFQQGTVTAAREEIEMLFAGNLWALPKHIDKF